ncbi:glycosyltransferase family 4 protein [Candidatus Kaiserbacteria bacterium]|nr:glycosyltransferase family 4 protein [Candidatus Kaiserbacteria bacterium]
MKALVLTQAVDKDDPVLGFFHGWLQEFARHFEHIEVVCLKEGSHSLPSNVRIHSLGKERGASRLTYAWRFYRYTWSLRHEYDVIFVHMNQEYVLLGGKLWWILRKPVYLWRNHYAGGWMTDIAAMFCKKVFCTSKYSYTAKYRKTVLMPVGVDMNVFKPLDVERRANSVLSLGRIAPSKRLEVLIEALRILKEKGITVQAEIVGEPLPKHAAYRDALQKLVRDSKLEVHMSPGVPNDETPKLYSAYDIFVNCSGSGMYDKTIFEAAACGALVVASSEDFQSLAGESFSFSGKAAELAQKLEALLSLSESEREAMRRKLAELVQEHSLETLGRRLAEEMK